MTINNKITMSTEQIERLLMHTIKNNRKILLVGKPGIGKTAICEDLISKLNLQAEKEKYELYSETSSCSDAMEYKGIPFGDKTSAVFVSIGLMAKIKSMLLPENKDKILVILFDDIGQAEIDVMKALMPVVQCKNVNGFKMPENIRIIGATNGCDDEAGVDGIIEPLKSRFHSIVNVLPEVNSWCRYAYEKGLNSNVIAYVRTFPDCLIQTELTTDIVNNCNPRQLEEFSKWVDSDLADDLRLGVYAGCIGSAHTAQFLAFERMVNELPNINDICSGTYTNVSDRLDVNIAIVTSLLHCITQDNEVNIFKYIELLDAPVQVIFMTDLINKNKNYLNNSLYTKWCIKNQDIFKSV